MRARCRFLIQQTIPAGQSMTYAVPAGSCRSWPDRPPGHLSPVITPAKWHRASTASRPSIHCSGTEKFPPPSRYFAAKPHPRKIVTRAESSFCPRAQVPKVLTLEDWLVLEMCSTSEHVRLPWLTRAKIRIRYWLHESQKLWWPPHIQFLLQIVTEANQLSLTQECAVHQHSQRLAIIANPYWER